MPASPQVRCPVLVQLALAAWLCAATGLDANAQPRLVRGPYLQMGTPHSVVVRWRTDLPAEHRVVYGTNLTALESVAVDPGTNNDHEVQVRGLDPATRYYYACANGTGFVAPPSSNQFFVTAPPPGTPGPTRIWVIGDAGLGTPDQLLVRDAYYSFTGTNHTHLWLQLGDNAYYSGTDPQYQTYFFNVYGSLLRKSVTWPTLGNHDTADSTLDTTNYAYFSVFTLPKAGEAGGEPSGTENYYSFDHGNIHFVCLNSMTVSRSATGPMASWLRADLARNTNLWTIVFWHHSPYSKGSHDSDTEIELLEMRESFVPILDRYGADLVLSGNSHSYERSFLLDGHYGVSTNLLPRMVLHPGLGRPGSGGPYLKPMGSQIGRRGAVYVVAGSSGQVRPGILNHPAMAYCTNGAGSLVLDVDGPNLNALFLSETGVTNDSFSLVKTNYPPVARNTVVYVERDQRNSLELKGSDPNRDPIQFSILRPPEFGLLSGFDPNTGKVLYTPARHAPLTDSFRFAVSDSEAAGTSGTATLFIAPHPDTDSNGLADGWERDFSVTDPYGDEDWDGVSNWFEYVAGTSPRDPGSCFRLLPARLNADGHVVLTWPSVGGVRYRVCFSDEDPELRRGFRELARPAVSEIAPGAPGEAGFASFTDDFGPTGKPAFGVRYYRIQIVGFPAPPSFPPRP